MTTIQIRVDERTKQSAKKILDKVGLDMSSAIKLYLKQISLRKGLPFQVLTENGLTPEEEDQILIASKEAEQGINVSPEMEADEAIEYLKKL
jgi:DNA-damage-inducible protein J